MNRFVFLIFFLFTYCSLYGQKVIVALGSSTTMGAAATSNDSAWAGRLQSFFRKNISPTDPDTIIYKLGGYGYTSYHVMPTGWVSPVANRPAADPANNITAALGYNPDAVIINLPSNDVANLAQPWVSPGYTMKETMDNFRILYQYVISSGASCYIATTQPRNDLTTDQRLMQRQLVDSIYNNFGSSSLNFWDDLATQDGSHSLRDDVRHIGYADSQFHLNNFGHFLLYEKVKAKELFPLNAPLPIRLAGFSGKVHNNEVRLVWETAEEPAGSFFEVQRSANGRQYTTLHSQTGKGNGPANYTWNDLHPLPGKSFYRLQIREPGKTWYSGVISIQFNNRELFIDRMMVNGSELVAELSSHKSGAAMVQLTAVNGMVLLRKNVFLSHPQSTIRLTLDNFPAGEYFFSVTPETGKPVVQRFVKIK